MRKLWYYASCTVLVAFGSVFIIGTVMKDGPGPVLVALVLIGAVIGFINGKSDD